MVISDVDTGEFIAKKIIYDQIVKFEVCVFKMIMHIRYTRCFGFVMNCQSLQVQ